MIETAVANTTIYLKVLANLERIRLLGSLIERAQTIDDLARGSTLRTSVIARHLALLIDAGLVNTPGSDDPPNYHINDRAFHQISKQVGQATAESAPDTIDRTERNLFTNFVKNNRLRQISEPFEATHLVILRWLAGRFEHGVRYAEKDVNAMLRQHHEDVATLRRALIDWGLLQRDHGV